MFNKESYTRHAEWYQSKFPTAEAKTAYFIKAKTNGDAHIGAWLQAIFFKCIAPLLTYNSQHWLTLGDAYGFDAQYLEKQGHQATASDLNTDFLAIAQAQGIISSYSAQNAEGLSYASNSFDYVLCKESYHHFPRPYAALYEMLRVAKKGLILIEPQDPITKMPLLLGIVNLLTKYKQQWANRFWRNRFSYEPVGNFVYKISERELEKLAAGLNLPLVAFKGINPNFYFEGANQQPATLRNRQFRRIYFKHHLRNALTRLGCIPSQVLSAIVFKEVPDEPMLERLKKEGYQLVFIPKNPFL